MSTELLSSPKLDFDLQKSNDDEEGEIMKNMMIQQEIECPRCYDVMSLSSDFDRLIYFCKECKLSLVMK
jgi:formamidopyrimidine-DNA glycosylase